MASKFEILATIEGDLQDSEQIILDQVLLKIKQICEENKCTLHIKQGPPQEECYPSYEGLK